MGFCVYNNIAIAARHLKRNRGLKRILVLDWDIHHGNGTQQAFYDDPNILFISIHRYDNGRFYPGTPLANYTYTGGSKAQGMNINIPWDCGKINDADYMYTFYNLIIPVLQEFNPEIILVSCGFDAVRNDPIGGCDLTPAGFAHMTHLLSQFAGGKVVLVLEVSIRHSYYLFVCRYINF
jgi:histone deacetylase 6